MFPRYHSYAKLSVPRFIYSGYENTASPNIINDISVLSLPGFQWYHSCIVIGKRQMVIVGCLFIYAGGYNMNYPPADPWAQGLGILDLPSLSWSDHYDAQASAYESPDVVKDC